MSPAKTTKNIANTIKYIFVGFLFSFAFLTNSTSSFKEPITFLGDLVISLKVSDVLCWSVSFTPEENFFFLCFLDGLLLFKKLNLLIFTTTIKNPNIAASS